MSLFSNITLGQYYPGASLLHRMDPRAKILALPLVMIMVLLADGTAGFIMSGIPVLLALLLAGIPPGTYWRGLKPLWAILLIGLAIQSLTYPGEKLWQWGMLSVSREGFILGMKLSYRLSLLILSTMLLTMTTTPMNLTAALEKLLQPLKKFGVPAHELAMMMTIALRFVPTLLEEAEAVMKAQQARGGSVSTGNLNQRLRASVALLVPLLAGSIRRADELAMAMEARGYRGDTGRTRLKQFKYRPVDIIVLTVLIALTIVVAADRWA
ncbi:energy-coupling factor transport system permease protein [Desulforamulus putei DSM 12395]|uniref:Energy-coupling factor transport system permease protein n=1 Tax=Desulforamulus putei DSM 12395 TaxID=1121429 RepID=A0A1M4WG86_9FIRM|nr:energy-coupling factor transporter transmembrane component T [Desulforamulus putei]SHE80197.1 energy-coupling factor transport system permease protein [Desulforamulus putei DSM 12395]